MKRSTSLRPRAYQDEGFTLVEIAIVLGILAIVVSAIWVVAASASENARMHTATRQLTMMVQNIRQLNQRINAFQAPFTDITALLDAQEAFPREMRQNQAAATGSLNHPWATGGGNVTVSERNASSFNVIYTALPQKACINLATRLSGGEITGLTNVLINTANQTLPVGLMAASARCNDATNPATNQIEWRFSLR